MREIRLYSDGLRLAAELYLPAEEGHHPALCICHGIPAGPPDPTDRGYSLLARRFRDAGFITMIFSFRGAGESQGNLDILGWTRDLGAALDFLCRLGNVDRTNLCLLGFSGGAAASLYTAAHDSRVSSVALCACPADFCSLREREPTAEAIQRFRDIGVIRDAGFPASIEEWDRGFGVVTPINWIDRISPRQLLIVHGDADELIPLEHAHRLYERAGDPKELRVIPGAGHRLRIDEAAMAAVLDWLRAKCQ
ncbi:MAG: alpha/beta hydrolase [Dehalococcoidia bacterium]